MKVILDWECEIEIKRMLIAGVAYWELRIEFKLNFNVKLKIEIKRMPSWSDSRAGGWPAAEATQLLLLVLFVIPISISNFNFNSWLAILNWNLLNMNPKLILCEYKISKVLQIQIK